MTFRAGLRWHMHSEDRRISCPGSWPPEEHDMFPSGALVWRFNIRGLEGHCFCFTRQDRSMGRPPILFDSFQLLWASLPLAKMPKLTIAYLVQFCTWNQQGLHISGQKSPRPENSHIWRDPGLSFDSVFGRIR